MFKNITSILLAASIALNMFLVYKIVDRSVTISQVSDRAEQRNKQLRTMEALFPLLISGRGKGDLEEAARKIGIDVIEKGPNEVWISEIEFHVVDNQVRSVNFH